jgi:serine/threonine protein kinase
MGETSYGKSVDLWATGFIMYELISGTHPLYVRGEDKQSYRDKLKNFKSISFNKGNFTR